MEEFDNVRLPLPALRVRHIRLTEPFQGQANEPLLKEKEAEMGGGLFMAETMRQLAM